MDEFDLQALLDAQDGYTQPTYQDYSEPDLSWFLNNTDLSGLDSTGQESGAIDLTSLLNPQTTTYDLMSPAQYEDYTGPLTEQEMIDWVSSSDMPMSEKIDYLQKLKLAQGIVEPGAYDEASAVVSPDEQSRSVKSVLADYGQSKDYAKLLQQSLQKQALQQMKAKQAYADSGIGKALSGLSMAALLAKTLTGKNQAPKVAARGNQGQTFAPTYQGASAPKTKYAFGGSVARSSSSRLNLPVNQPGFSANNPTFLDGSSGTWSNILNTVRASAPAPNQATLVTPALSVYKSGYRGGANTRTKYASGGEVKGGLLSLAEKMAREIAGKKGLIGGDAGGQDDVVDIKAAPGEYVMDAEVVSALGDGNNEEGARKLDQMRVNVRKHKRTGGLSSIPPKAKKPEQYMKKGK